MTAAHTAIAFDAFVSKPTVRKSFVKFVMKNVCAVPCGGICRPFGHWPPKIATTQKRALLQPLDMTIAAI